MLAKVAAIISTCVCTPLCHVFSCFCHREVESVSPALESDPALAGPTYSNRSYGVPILSPLEDHHVNATKLAFWGMSDHVEQS